MRREARGEGQHDCGLSVRPPLTRAYAGQPSSRASPGRVFRKTPARRLPDGRERLSEAPGGALPDEWAELSEAMAGLCPTARPVAFRPCRGVRPPPALHSRPAARRPFVLVLVDAGRLRPPRLRAPANAQAQQKMAKPLQRNPKGAALLPHGAFASRRHARLGIVYNTKRCTSRTAGCGVRRHPNGKDVSWQTFISAPTDGAPSSARTSRTTTWCA